MSKVNRIKGSAARTRIVTTDLAIVGVLEAPTVPNMGGKVRRAVPGGIVSVSNVDGVDMANSEAVTLVADLYTSPPRTAMNIKRLMDLATYRGLRAAKGNSKTPRRKKVAVRTEKPISVAMTVTSKKAATVAKAARTRGDVPRIIKDLNVGLADRAARAGAAPGKPLDEPAVATALQRIAASAKDLFGSADAAMRYLDRDDFGSTGLSSRELLASGRGTSIIARLDTLRFGTQG